MSNPLPLLLNVVYGLLFFLGFGVALLTAGAFTLALRDTFLRRRPPESHE